MLLRRAGYHCSIATGHWSLGIGQMATVLASNHPILPRGLFSTRSVVYLNFLFINSLPHTLYYFVFHLPEREKCPKLTWDPSAFPRRPSSAAPPWPEFKASSWLFLRHWRSFFLFFWFLWIGETEGDIYSSPRKDAFTLPWPSSTCYLTSSPLRRRIWIYSERWTGL